MAINQGFDSPAFATGLLKTFLSSTEYGRRMSPVFSGLLGLALLCVVSQAAEAACKKGALGTSRTIVIDAAKHRSFDGSDAALGLRSKEVILTFDDGPIAGKTSSILRTLKKECVKATFFYVGKMARAYPNLVRQVVRQGHTLAHHTHNHDRLSDFSMAQASRKIDRGISGLQKIAYGDATSTPRTPFFRYPYFARTDKTDQLLARKGMVAFGANIDSLDWKPSSPKQVHDRIMRRLRKAGKGIILMHDIQTRTAKMLPLLLRSLAAEGYRVVHIVAKQNSKPAIKAKPAPKAEPLLLALVELPSSTNANAPNRIKNVRSRTVPSKSVRKKTVRNKTVRRKTVRKKRKATNAGFRYLNNRQLAKLSAKAQTRYWTRYWYVKRGRRIPKHLR